MAGVRLLTRTTAAAACAAALMLSLGGPAGAARPVTLRASVDGHDLAGASRAHPLRLRDDKPVVVTIRVANNGSREAVVRGVRLQGRVIGLALFSYEARVELRVAPGSTEELSYATELVDLHRQAVGLIPGRIQLLDENRRELAGQSFTSDARGSAFSVYGLFALAVIGITVVLLVGAFGRLAAGRLPANRFRRGLRFGTAGVGVGLALTFSLSALRILLPSPGIWLTLIALCGGGLFAFGYLAPGGDPEVVYDEPREMVGARSG